jgi:hypothetical protein
VQARRGLACAVFTSYESRPAPQRGAPARAAAGCIRGTPEIECNLRDLEDDDEPDHGVEPRLASATLAVMPALVLLLPVCVYVVLDGEGASAPPAAREVLEKEKVSVAVVGVFACALARVVVPRAPSDAVSHAAHVFPRS